jgi:crotonobetainyl-CoA:carnitine CoA-transferase CaiB-like acyl-CoA transferase
MTAGSTGGGGVLEGVRVVELSQLIAAPLCGLTLADYGAEVIKVEPAGGEYTRTLEPILPSGESAYFHMLNRGKRSLALDFGAAGARELVARLIDGADVVVESLGAGAAAFAGYDDAAARNPRLVWCSITGTGWGEDGRAIDPTLQASMGMMALTGDPDGPPMRLPVPLVDFLTGVYAVQSILAALLAMQRTGRGAHLDCAMVDAAATLASSVGVYALNGERPIRRLGTQNMWYVPAANFPAADGRWVQLMAFGEHHWRVLSEVLGHPEWIDRYPSNAARVARREEVHVAIAAVIATDTAEHWAEQITAAGAFCQRIREIEEAWADPLLTARGLRVDLDTARDPPFPVPTASLARDASRNLRPGPRLGEHSREIAAEIGVDPGWVDALVQDRVLVT